MTRSTIWNNIGKEVNGKSVDEVLKNAKLNWDVTKKPVVVDGKVYPDAFATVRSDNEGVLGIVGTRYNIINNKEAFGFIDNLLDNKGIQVEKAGELGGGKKVWMIAKMPDATILGDGVTPYMIFSNAHDGSGMVKIAIVPLRIICQNQLNFAFKKADRAWNIRHVKSFESRLEEAKETLQLANTYMKEFEQQAESFAKKKVTQKQFQYFAEELFVVPQNATDKKIEKVMEQRAALKNMYHADDLGNFQGTAWGLLNAVSDMNTHLKPQKNTDNWEENRFARMLEGYQMKMMDDAMNILQKVTA